MKRVLRDEEARLWAKVTATVRPLVPERAALQRLPVPLAEPEPVKVPLMRAPQPMPLTPFMLGAQARSEAPVTITPARRDAPDPIEPNRKRRISRERDPVEARLDLHGYTSFTAALRVRAFLEQAYASDFRAVLIITGKGAPGIGVLKRDTPEWLADPVLAHIVAGVSDAHPRHGGTGALYVALKKRRQT